MNRSRALLVVMLATIAAGVGLASPAAAHNTLIGSSPADGSTVHQAPTTVALTFDEPVTNYQPVMTVTGPNGNSFAVGDPVVSGSVVSIGVSAGPAGRYTAAYRVVSADGHPVYGEIAYTVDSAGAGTAAGSTPAPSAGPAAHAAVQGSSGLAWWLWGGIGIAVLPVIAAAAVILRPSRAPRGDRAA